MTLHLDTHVLVFLYAGELKRIPKSARQALETHSLAISPAVVLELQYLFEIRRTTEPAEVVMRDLAGRLGVAVDDAPFAAVVNTATSLSWTRDPFDRLIVAHAQTRDARLLTADTTIQKHYAGALWGGKR